VRSSEHTEKRTAGMPREEKRLEHGIRRVGGSPEQPIQPCRRSGNRREYRRRRRHSGNMEDRRREENAVKTITHRMNNQRRRTAWAECPHAPNRKPQNAALRQPQQGGASPQQTARPGSNASLKHRLPDRRAKQHGKAKRQRWKRRQNPQPGHAAPRRGRMRRSDRNFETQQWNRMK